MSALPLPPQRLAVESDAPRISELMRSSVLELVPHFYDQQQAASAAVHIAQLDMQLIEDGTYFVHETADPLQRARRPRRRSAARSQHRAGEGASHVRARRLDEARIGRAILESCERDARDEGFQSFVLGATLPGAPLYPAFEFREVERLT